MILFAEEPTHARCGERQAYSVLLQYPTYRSAEGDTYYTCVAAHSVAQAIARARQVCLRDNTEETRCGIANPQDLRVLLVTEGYAPDVKP